MCSVLHGSFTVLLSNSVNESGMALLQVALAFAQGACELCLVVASSEGVAVSIGDASGQDED